MGQSVRLDGRADIVLEKGNRGLSLWKLLSARSERHFG